MTLYIIFIINNFLIQIKTFPASPHYQQKSHQEVWKSS